MDPDSARRAAGLLRAARRSVEPIAALPADCRPVDAAEGYAIQAAFRTLCDDEVAGYKIGATSERAQQFLDTDRPFAVHLLRSKVFLSPGKLPAGAFPFILLEPEVAFRLGAPLPPREAPYEAAEVAAAAESLHPAFEIVTSALENWSQQGAPSLIADNGVHGALVLGPGTTDWQDLDLPMRKIVSEGRGANALGSPLLAMTWLANHLSGRDLGLEAGQIVTTGVVTEFRTLQAGDLAIADYGALGRIQLAVTG